MVQVQLIGEVTTPAVAWEGVQVMTGFTAAPVPLGVAFMAGEIYSYNAALWKSILTGLLALTDATLITVGTEAEAALVEGWCTEEERDTEVFENRRDPLYDRWCCVARRV